MKTGVCADLLSSQGCVVQARAERSLSASVAMVVFLNCDQANSHSLTPPAVMALQYTVERRLGWILKNNDVFKVQYILIIDRWVPFTYSKM